jgi:hypothetical protein
MEDTAITSLVKYILPTDITDYFTIKEVKEEIDTLSIFLDERNILPEDHKDKPLESKGFYPEVRIEDFPIREYKVYLIVRRRKWKDLDTGKVVSRDWELTAQGTSYTKEFGAFLKEMA